MSPEASVCFSVIGMGEVESTQTEVQRLAAAGAPEGTVVTARHQRAGRGSRGHDWWDAPGESLLASVLLRPAGPSATAPQLSPVAGLAVAEALATVAGVPVRIRWPNDLLIDGRKVCGLLAEAASDGAGRLLHVVLGIGVNLGQIIFPEALAERATSLRLVTGRAHEAGVVLGSVLTQLGRRYAEWQAGGFAALRADWLAHSLLPGQVVRLPDGTLGLGEDLSDDGTLVVRSHDGGRLRLVSGGAVEEATAHAAGR
jgi:BirA family biotin operon repressor/biotin-[acetyl-CoA-carboxylase] ligase